MWGADPEEDPAQEGDGALVGELRCGDGEDKHRPLSLRATALDDGVFRIEVIQNPATCSILYTLYSAPSLISIRVGGYQI
jgi:hypothetical protein